MLDGKAVDDVYVDVIPPETKTIIHGSRFPREHI